MGAAGTTRLGDETRAGHHADDRKRHIHEEDRSPPEMVEQEAAGDRPYGQARCPEHRPGGHRRAAFIGREQNGEDGEGGTDGAGRPDAHERTRGDERLGRRCQGGD